MKFSRIFENIKIIFQIGKTIRMISFLFGNKIVLIGCYCRAAILKQWLARNFKPTSSFRMNNHVDVMRMKGL